MLFHISHGQVHNPAGCLVEAFGSVYVSVSGVLAREKINTLWKEIVIEWIEVVAKKSEDWGRLMVSTCNNENKLLMGGVSDEEGRRGGVRK